MAKKGSIPNESGLERRRRRGQGTPADYGSVDGELIKAAITAAAITGGALRFGYSRDGGAFAIGIYGDGEPYTEFVRPSENLDDTLESIIELFDGIADDQKRT